MSHEGICVSGIGGESKEWTLEHFSKVIRKAELCLFTNDNGETHSRLQDFA